jgi:hypothetical protein
MTFAANDLSTRSLVRNPDRRMSGKSPGSFAEVAAMVQLIGIQAHRQLY